MWVDCRNCTEPLQKSRPLLCFSSIITQVKKGFIWLPGRWLKIDFLMSRVWMEEFCVHQNVLLWNHRVGSWPLVPVLWTYMNAGRNYRVGGRSTGMKSNSCSSVDINAIVRSTYTARRRLYSVSFQAIAACIFSLAWIQNVMYPHISVNTWIQMNVFTW